MGYKAKVTTKEERKQGVEAAKRVGADGGISKQVALAVVKLNRKKFEEVDELDNAKFCQVMQMYRENDADGYAIFWWWRMALEEAAKNHEEDPDFKEPEFRMFAIIQFLAAPFDWDAWEDDRIHLKPGVEPWISDEQIQLGLDHKSIKRWAYIWHWRDIYTEEEEIGDRNCQRKAGERKFKHAHVLCEAPGKVTLSQVCRWFGVPPTQVKMLRGQGAFNEFLEYLFHLSPAAIEAGKTVYDFDEVVCSAGLDAERIITDLQANRAKYGKKAGAMTADDTMRMHVLNDGWTLSQCEADDPLTFAKPGVEGNLQRLRLRYLKKQPPCPNRLTLYVGPEDKMASSGIGKTAFCRYLAGVMFSAYEQPYFEVGRGQANVRFLGYDGEPCILYNEERASRLIRDFGADLLDLFETHPGTASQNTKGSAVVLHNMVNIINGAQPWQEFVGDLAQYFLNEGEDLAQVARRIAAIINVRQDSFDVLINAGYIDREQYGWQQFQMFKQVQGNVGRIAERLDGAAKQKMLVGMGAPVLEAVAVVQRAHDDKVSDPDQIPDEFADYGKVRTAADIAAEEEARLYEKWEAEAELFCLYRQYLDEFMTIRDNLDRIGPMPEGWTRGEHPMLYMWDERDGMFSMTEMPNDDEPLDFANWRHYTSGGTVELKSER